MRSNHRVGRPAASGLLTSVLLSAVLLSSILLSACSSPPAAGPTRSQTGSTTTTATPTTPTSTTTTTSSPSTPSPSPSSSPRPTRSSTPSPHTTARPRPTTRPPTPTPSPSTLPRSLAGPVVTRIPTSRRVVALTFDGGAGAQGASKILAVLASQGVPASFYVTGQFATTNPGLTAAMARRGPVGNHSWSHPHFPVLSATETTAQLTRTRSAILAATARDPKPFFRFPYGDYDARSLGRVHAAGYGAVGWTTDSLGWKGTSGGQSVDSVVDRVLRNRTPGQIVLMHVGANPDDHTTLDADALARIIAGYRAAGYGFVTLEALR